MKIKDYFFFEKKKLKVVWEPYELFTLLSIYLSDELIMLSRLKCTVMLCWWIIQKCISPFEHFLVYKSTFVDFVFSNWVSGFLCFVINLILPAFYFKESIVGSYSTFDLYRGKSCLKRHVERGTFNYLTSWSLFALEADVDFPCFNCLCYVVGCFQRPFSSKKQ